MDRRAKKNLARNLFFSKRVLQTSAKINAILSRFHAAFLACAYPGLFSDEKICIPLKKHFFGG